MFVLKTTAQYRKGNGWKLTSSNKFFREYLSGLASECCVKRSDTIAAAVRKRNARRTNTPLAETTNVSAVRRRVPILCGDKYQRLAKKLHPRRQNWESWREVTYQISGGWEIYSKDHGNYSRQHHYTKWSYIVLVSSYGLVLSPQRLRVRLGTDTRLIDAPHGYHWGQDDDGIKLVANANANARADYHPTAEELSGPMRELTQILRENYRTRQAEAKADRARAKADKAAKRRQAATMRQAVREGLAVCVADSRRAGNCGAGSASWATRHGLDPSRHYTPAQLLDVANGDTRRVTLVIHRAMQRHHAEQAAGVCLLADHA